MNIPKIVFKIFTVVSAITLLFISIAIFVYVWPNGSDIVDILFDICKDDQDSEKCDTIDTRFSWLSALSGFATGILAVSGLIFFFLDLNN